jgi:hypothetical protein
LKTFRKLSKSFLPNEAFSKKNEIFDDDDDNEDLIDAMAVEMILTDDLNTSASASLILSEEINNQNKTDFLFRERWRKDYLMNSAMDENTFLAKYRLDINSFKALHQLIKPILKIIEDTARIY